MIACQDFIQSNIDTSNNQLQLYSQGETRQTDDRQIQDFTNQIHKMKQIQQENKQELGLLQSMQENKQELLLLIPKYKDNGLVENYQHLVLLPLPPKSKYDLDNIEFSLLTQRPENYQKASFLKPYADDPE